MSSRRPSRALSVSRHAILAATSALVLFPFLWMLVASLKKNDRFFDAVLLPSGDGALGIDWSSLTLENYTNLFSLGFAQGFFNSALYASTTALVATLLCAACGYVLAAVEFRGRALVTAIVLAALIVPPSVLIAPTYELLHELRLLDTMWGLVLPSFAPAFGVFLFRQSVVQSVPKELLDAARLDGCSEFRVFVLVVLPLLRPMIGAFMLITFLAMWNNFITPQIVLQSEHKQPLSVAIAQLRGVYRTDYGLLMAATVVSVAPVGVLFLVLQKQFIAGFTAGAVKG
jgi:multiple sugar transport system permease protein